jgi:translocation protein SEC63
MAGMKFEYDENGGKFYYFLLSVYGLILLPATYWLWPKVEKRKSAPHPEDTSNFSLCRNKYQLLHANEPNRRRRAIITKIILVLAWIILIVLAYRVSLIEIEHKEYDPFAVLNVDREASISEIKRAYRDLSKKHHPDRGGDPEQFKEIAKAYKTLTDEEAKENWKKYGNPDGPGVTHFGIALPKWLVDHQNSVFVLLVYAGIFMIVLPVIVCVWWQKSARYSGDQILIDTIQLYWIFLSKTSSIIIKRAIMILSASREFDRTRNPLIIDRESDNVELPKLFRELPDVQEKTKERPFQLPYCLKTRTLLHAHIHRLNTLSDNLEKDKRYIVKKAPYLINEMINIEAQLVAMGHAGRLRNPPRLDTLENTMKLSPMIVQALWNTKSPLLQLPHITESHLRYFETKKHTIKSIRQFAAIDNEARRSMLRSITDEQYDDIMNVLSIYPHVTMEVSCEVFDDEEVHKITTGAVVTLTIHLHRENMSTVFNKELGLNAVENETHEDQREDKENQEKGNEASKGAVAAAASNTSKGWNNKSDKKKKTKKKGPAPPSKPVKTSTAPVPVVNKSQTKESSDDDSSKHADDSPSNLRHRHEQSKEETNNSDNDDEALPNTQKKSRKNSDNDEDTFLERFQQQQRKREKLETKAKISHRVFCPFYPEIKQECWWLYVADPKHSSLISAPVYICTLKDREEVEVKFSAPKVPGDYTYWIILTSDSYFDVDVKKELRFKVEAAKEMDDNHPQWDFSEDEGTKNTKAEDEEFATESESDEE